MGSLYFLQYGKQGDELVFDKTTNDNYIQVYSCIQEILLWKGESNFYADSGIDYKEIFNSNKFLRSDLENIISKYEQFFTRIVYEIKQVDSVTFQIDLSFYFGDGSLNFSITNDGKDVKILKK